MSGGDHKKSKKRRRRDREEDNIDDTPRKSLIDYSKVADRHVDDQRFEKHRQAGPSSSTAAVGGTSTGTTSTTQQQQQKPKVSSQMAAVMRIMTGKEERTISEKLADSNRPTW